MIRKYRGLIFLFLVLCMTSWISLRLSGKSLTRTHAIQQAMKGLGLPSYGVVHTFNEGGYKNYLIETDEGILRLRMMRSGIIGYRIEAFSISPYSTSVHAIINEMPVYNDVSYFFQDSQDFRVFAWGADKIEEYQYNDQEKQFVPNGSNNALQKVNDHVFVSRFPDASLEMSVFRVKDEHNLVFDTFKFWSRKTFRITHINQALLETVQDVDYIQVYPGVQYDDVTEEDAVFHQMFTEDERVMPRFFLDQRLIIDNDLDCTDYEIWMKPLQTDDYHQWVEEGMKLDSDIAFLVTLKKQESNLEESELTTFVTDAVSYLKLIHALTP